MPSGPLVLVVFLVALAIALPWLSDRLGRRNRADQARVTDLKAYFAKLPSSNTAGLAALLDQAQRAQRRSEWLQGLDVLQRMEWVAYDWRLSRPRASVRSADVVLVAADDWTFTVLSEGGLSSGENYDYMWPRMPVYGRALRELRALGVTAVGFDVTFQDLLHEHERHEQDLAFSRELNRYPGAPAILAIAPNQEPAGLFQARAAAVGDVAITKDADAVSRRVRAYTDFVQWHPQLGVWAAREEWILDPAIDFKSVMLKAKGEEAGVRIPVDEQGLVPLRTNRFGVVIKVPLAVTNRVWHLGLVLAAYQMKLDLKQSGIEGDELLLRATNGAVLRRVPVDQHGYFPVNWTLRAGPGSGSALITVKLEELMEMDWARANSGRMPTNQLRGRLALVGSTASANNLADQGATPLGNVDHLVGTHVNVANQILTDTCLRVGMPFPLMATLMAGLVLMACFLTWNLRGFWPLIGVAGIGAGWFWVAVWVFDTHRWVLPIAHPLIAGLIIPYGAMVSVRAISEQRERQRVRSVFAKMVSPDIVQEMLGTGRIELGGSRRELSVLFADIRGFTALTDRYQAEAEHYVTEHNLSGAAAEAHYDARAREVLETVNLFLGAIADVVKFHQGTLDKYIGDCVMAFWGAPVVNPQHCVNCVIAAIDSQRIIARLNAQRAAENDRRAAANQAQPELKLEMLPLVSLGTGVNTGAVTVGLMGSDAHIVNYTVFGREVNLASRLEGVSGYARIVIGEATYKGLQQHAPALAEICRALEPVPVKGFRLPVLVYEVPWQESEVAAAKSRLLYQATPPAGFQPVVLKAKPGL